MFAALLRNWFPKSLRSQFVLTVAALELSVVAGSLTAIYALRQSVGATRKLAEQRLVHMQQANDLLQRTFLIEHEAERMLTADSTEELRIGYDEMINQLEEFDRLVEQLGTASSDVSVLPLVQSGQMFRNTAHVLAGLREEELQAEQAASPRGQPHSSDQQAATSREETLRSFHHELQDLASSMVTSAQGLSNRFTSEYRDAVSQMADKSKQNERWVLGMVAGSLVLAWLVTKYFLGRQVISRLHLVSKSLRLSDPGIERPCVPVQGEDEIAEMARAVEQFLEDRQRLSEVNKELEAFSYSVSHDLRAPLRAIDGFSQILLEDYPTQLDEEGRNYLDRIRFNALRMRDLIDDILNLSRTSRREMAMEPVDIPALAQEVFEEIRGTVPERSIVLRLGNLPPANGDVTLIRQLLVNLISNAVKFTALQPEAVIEIDCVNTDDENTYRVKDNGVGFDMQYANKLFGVFQRLHGAEQFEGTGIGLAIVKRIVLRHGGRVWAESQPGQGASIYFSLPSAKASATETEKWTAKQRPI